MSLTIATYDVGSVNAYEQSARLVVFRGCVGCFALPSPQARRHLWVLFFQTVQLLTPLVVLQGAVALAHQQQERK